MLYDVVASMGSGLRDNWRPIVLYLVAPVMLIPAAVVAVALMVASFGSDQRVNAPDSANTPAPERVVTMLQLFACLRSGPQDCADFGVTLTFLDRISDGTFTYTPMTPNDPGQAVADGQRQVKLATLGTAQARAVGVAVARTDSIPSTAEMIVARRADELETVTFVEANLRGTVAFALRSGTYSLLSITYQPR